MAYSDFLNLKQAEKKLGLTIKDINLFPLSTPTATISQRLVEDIDYAKKMPLMSKKAKSELVISPIFKEVKLSNQHFNYFSGCTFDVDSSLSLIGICDFLFTLNTNKIVFPPHFSVWWRLKIVLLMKVLGSVHPKFTQQSYIMSKKEKKQK